MIIKKEKFFFIVILLIFLLCIQIFFNISCKIFDSEPEKTETSIEKGIEKEITIAEGMNLTQISELLEENGIIDDALYFKLYVEEKKLEKKLLPGTYKMLTLSGYGDVLDMISSGPVVVTYKLIIPEGFTLQQITERILEQVPTISSQDISGTISPEIYDYDFLKIDGVFVKSLEGFLFPKTYEILQDYTLKNIIEMMLSQYQFETSSLDYTKSQEKDLDYYDILIIASMIEREAYIPEERELISAVIHNRLEAGMSLGIDATLSYFLGKWEEPLTKSDLETDTPYNTRIYTGLPPTPICNPGIECIKAALFPADVDYLYYVVTDQESHKHSFSTTLEEHNQNVNNSQNQ
ncbi:MAG TPA: endolytic transglycosylase MltG [Actinobacteria bacterium]|nr:endolytic transglycosylase MltG [Actinomycetota bacterium]